MEIEKNIMLIIMVIWIVSLGIIGIANILKKKEDRYEWGWNNLEWT